MVHHSQCPLCGSASVSNYMKCRDHFLTKEMFDLSGCSSCGFIFISEAPDKKEAGRYYDSKDYISHDDSAGGLSGRIYLIIRWMMLVRKKRLITRLTGRTSGELLDIGTGSGHFAGMMKQSGWNVTGIEPDKKAADYAASRFGLRIAGPDEITGIPGETFDCITLWHSLEHSHDLHSYASEIRRLLKPEGICIVALPSAASLDAQHYREFWAAWDVPRHLWHFTPAAFSFFAERAGFSITGIKDLPFDVFYISFLSEKYRGANLPFIAGMVNGLRFYLTTLFRRKGSSSLMYILKKKAE